MSEEKIKCLIETILIDNGLDQEFYELQMDMSKL